MKLFSKCREDLVTVIEQKLSIFDDNGMFAGCYCIEYLFLSPHGNL